MVCLAACSLCYQHVLLMFYGLFHNFIFSYKIQNALSVFVCWYSICMHSSINGQNCVRSQNSLICVELCWAICFRAFTNQIHTQQKQGRFLMKSRSQVLSFLLPPGSISTLTVLFWSTAYRLVCLFFLWRSFLSSCYRIFKKCLRGYQYYTLQKRICSEVK